MANVYPADQQYVAAPVQQAMLDSNQLRPMLVPKSNGAAGALLYTSYAHPDIKNWFCLRSFCSRCNECGCLAGVSRELKQSTYTKVYDNKIEWNEPANLCTAYRERGCCPLCYNCNVCNWACHQFDDTFVVHYDRAIVANAVPALGFCRPCGTHAELCPNGCPGCYHGESVVLYATTPGCCWGQCDMSPWCRICQVKYIHQQSNIGGACCGAAAWGTPCCPPYRVIRGVDNAQQLATAINNARVATGIQPVTLGKQDFK